MFCFAVVNLDHWTVSSWWSESRCGEPTKLTVMGATMRNQTFGLDNETNTGTQGMWKKQSCTISKCINCICSYSNSFLSLRPFSHASKKSVPSKYKWQSIYTYLVLPFTVHLPGKLQFCLLFNTWFILRWKECKHLFFFEEIQLSFASKLPNLQIACPHTSPYSNSLLETGSVVPWFWPQSWFQKSSPW